MLHAGDWGATLTTMYSKGLCDDCLYSSVYSSVLVQLEVTVYICTESLYEFYPFSQLVPTSVWDVTKLDRGRPRL